MKKIFTEITMSLFLAMTASALAFAQGGDEGNLLLNETMTDAWSFGDEAYIYYTLELPASGNLTIETSRTGSINCSVKVFNSAGDWINPVAASIPDPVHGFCFREGTYLVEVYREGFEGSSGTHSLTASMQYPDISTDAEPNDAIAEIAQTLALDEVFTGQLGYSTYTGNPDISDYYKVAVPDDGSVTMDVDFFGDEIISGTLYILDKWGNTIINVPADNGSNSVTAHCRKADTLIVRILTGGLGCLTYSASVSLESPQIPNEAEDNNTFEEASEIFIPGESITGRVGYRTSPELIDTDDYFKIVTTEDGNISIATSASDGLTASLTLYYKNGQAIGNTAMNEGETLTTNCLAADTFYVWVSYGAGCGTYQAEIDVSGVMYGDDQEPNNTPATAIPLYAGIQNTGHLGFGDVDLESGVDGDDYYYFEVNEVPFSMQMNALAEPNFDGVLQLRDPNNALIVNTPINEDNDWQLNLSLSLNVTGFYYLRMLNSSGCGAYSLSSNVLSTNQLDTDLIEVFPNPFNSELTILVKEGGYQVKLFDIAGRPVHNQMVTGQVSIETGHLAKGIYLLELTDVDSGKRMATKLLRQ